MYIEEWKEKCSMCLQKYEADRSLLHSLINMCSAKNRKKETNYRHNHGMNFLLESITNRKYVLYATNVHGYLHHCVNYVQVTRQREVTDSKIVRGNRNQGCVGNTKQGCS